MTVEPRTEAAIRKQLIHRLDEGGYEWEEIHELLDSLRAAALREVAEAVSDVRAPSLSSPGFEYDHEEGCAYAYANLTYNCYCLVPRAAIRAILTEATADMGAPSHVADTSATRAVGASE